MLRTLLAIGLLSAAPAWASPEAGAPDLYSPESLQARTERLKAVEADLANARARREALEREIATLENDRKSLTKALVTVAARRQEVEEAIGGTRERLDALAAERRAIRTRVAGRRDVLVEVLAALQRMGSDPPPAIVVSPADAVGSVRSAILLGAVVPQLRAETEVLLADLAAFEEVRNRIVVEKNKLANQLQSVEDDATRLALLADRKAELIEGSRAALLAEQRRAAALAERATSLTGLIADLESEIASARRAAAAARAADERRAAQEARRLEAARAEIARAREARKPLSAGVFSDTARLEPAVAFDQAKGLLPRPVAGPIVRRFGEKAGRTTARNVAFQTRPGAHVRSPADGWVLYAGPFRSYGHLLIVNAGDGYHVVLMGLDGVSVSPGRFVLAGEPVGRMADAPGGAADVIAVSDGSKVEAEEGPVLSVEFRRDGRPVDPSPWWAKNRILAGKPVAPGG